MAGIPKKNAKKSRKKRRPLPGLFRIYAVIIVVLAFIITGLIFYLDHRASEGGYGGLWGYFRGIPVLRNADAVRNASMQVLASMGVFSDNAINQIQTPDRQDLTFLAFNIDSASIFNKLNGSLEVNLKNAGVTIYKSYTTKKNRYQSYIIQVGTRQKCTHQFEMILYRTGLEQPETRSDSGNEGKTGGLVADNPRIALVFDDFGGDLRIAEEFLTQLDFPITLAVLPFMKYSTRIAEMVKDKDQSLFLHLPLEPFSGDAAKGSTIEIMKTGMNRNEMEAYLLRAMENVPDVDGINNHMGSRFTSDLQSMRSLFALLKGHGVPFLDSRTSPKSVADQVAVEFGLPFAERSVFLDQGYVVDDVDGNLKRLEETARRKGVAIAIGHAQPLTLASVRRHIPEMIESGFRIVPVTDLLHVPDDTEDINP